MNGGRNPAGGGDTAIASAVQSHAIARPGMPGGRSVTMTSAPSATISAARRGPDGGAVQDRAIPIILAPGRGPRRSARKSAGRADRRGDPGGAHGDRGPDRERDRFASHASADLRSAARALEEVADLRQQRLIPRRGRWCGDRLLLRLRGPAQDLPAENEDRPSHDEKI